MCCRLKRLHLKLNQSLEVQLDKLIDTRGSVVISQNLYFLLNFDFVNKMYFLSHRISICTYVGLKFFYTKNGPQGRKGWETLF